MKDLTGATGVMKIQVRGTTGAGVEVGAVVINTTTREWYYAWQAGDTDLAEDIYDVEVWITYADGTVEVFPGRAMGTLIMTDAIVVP
jgi:hypothetical protein